MPIRIAFCITELDPGGAEWALVELVTRLDRSQFEPAVFCLGPRGKLADALEQARVPVTCLGATRSRQFWVVFRLMKALRRFQPAILQTWLYHANLLGRVAGRLARVPIIVSGIRVAEKRSRWRLRLDRLTQSLVDVHVCVSKAVAKHAIDEGGLAGDRVVVIPNGVDFEKYASARPTDRAALGISERAKVVLFVGRLDPQKDPGLALDVIENMPAETGDVHLILAGEGCLKSQILDRIGYAPNAGKVHILGRRADVPELLQAADLLLLTSRWEGMPNVVLEASAAGKPVVTTQVEGVAELLEAGVPLNIVSSRNPSEIACVISEILRNPNGNADLGRKSQDVVLQKFTWSIFRKSYQELYRKLLADHSQIEDPDGPDSVAKKIF